MAKREKKKKEKIVYIDDGRTIADMSNVGTGRPRLMSKGTTSKPRDIWHTYWDAFRMMLGPTLVFAAALAVVFLIVSLIFHML